MFKFHFTFILILMAFVTQAQWEDNSSNASLEPHIKLLNIKADITLTSPDYNLKTTQLRMRPVGNKNSTFNDITVNRESQVVTYDYGSYYGTNDRLVFRSFGESSANRPSDYINTMTLTKQGTVGIGTDTTGNHKLAVEGSIGARKIQVEATGWSDFVFAEDYNLKSLEEVASFVEENNHLPDVPSEAEVLENGIDVATMNATLLQKIEEITLYLIDVNNEVKTLKAENAALKARN